MVRSLLVRAAALALLAGQIQAVAGVVLCTTPRPLVAAACEDGMRTDGPAGPAVTTAAGDAAMPCALMGPCAQPAPALAMVPSLAAAPASTPAAPQLALVQLSSFDRTPTPPPPQA